MDCKNRIIKLRESTGLNRKDFCKLVHIPYRTMTEWELDNRHAPDYVLWLLEYYIRNEGLMVKEMNEGGGDSEKETKYSLQGTTQSRYLTGGVPPVRFSM